MRESLDSLTDPADEAQLARLDQSLQAFVRISSREKTELLPSLLGVFERFPTDDGYGVFWNILHAVEAIEGCEPAVVASVRARPAEFNVLLVGRLLNAGTTEVTGVDLLSLLREVAESSEAPDEVREIAQLFSEPPGA